jgi:hypothetical protein
MKSQAIDPWSTYLAELAAAGAAIGGLRDALPKSGFDCQ